MRQAFNKTSVLRWMFANAESYKDGSDLNHTALAEGAADHFGMADTGGPLDDPDHWIWELSLQVVELV